MYVVTVLFALNPGLQHDFLPLMSANASASLALEAGCRQFDVCLDPDRPDEVFLYELYDDGEAFQAHLMTPHFKAFASETAPMIAERDIRTFRRLSPEVGGR